jgi:hypothetical protein
MGIQVWKLQGNIRRECGYSHMTCDGSCHMCGKLCIFIHYNVQYVVFSVAIWC